MQVDAVAALAPVLARYAIVVDGPMEAEVLAARDRWRRPGRAADRARHPAWRPARRCPAPPWWRWRAGCSPAWSLGGTVEHVGGGYRIADPALAATLQAVVEQASAPPLPSRAAPFAPLLAAPGATPGAATLPPPGGAPVATEEASRLLQQALAARAGRLPVPAPAGPALPKAWAGFARAGWSPVLDAAAPQVVSHPGLPAAARIVVADPTAPPVAVAGRLGSLHPTSLAHLDAPPVTWGQGDAVAARALAAGLADALGAPAAARAPLVVDRGVVPGLAVLAPTGRLPEVVLVDLRSGLGRPVAIPPPPAGTPEPSLLAAAMAGATGARAPTRRPAARPRRGGDVAALMEVLFGPRCTAALAPGEEEDLAPPSTAGVVVTSRTDDPQADALAGLLGVEVLHLGAPDDLLPEVLAWLEDDEGRHLLAPRA